TPRARKICPCDCVAMPMIRDSTECSLERTGASSLTSRANRRPTLPNPISTRSNRMHDAGQQLADAREGAAQMRRLVAEADPQVAVHPEMIAGHQQDAFVRPQARHQISRVDRVVVTRIHD